MVRNGLLQKLLFLLAMIIFAGILIINIYDLIICQKDLWQEFQNIAREGYYIIFLILMVAVLTSCFYLIKCKLMNPLKISSPFVFALIIFLVSLIIKLIFVFVTKTEQYSDFQLFYWVTADIAKKTPVYLSQHYFSIWAYQIGYPAIMSPIMKIFGIDIVPLIITNCVVMAIKNIFIYFILRIICSEKTSRIASLAYAFFPFSLSLSSVYTNQHLAAMFLYIGLFILIYNKGLTIKRSIFAGMFFALSNMVRPEAILIIVSLLGFAIITTINKLNTISIKSKLKDIFLPIGCTILAYFIGTSIISQFFVVTGLSPYGLSNNFPLYKFVIGLNHSTSGSFSKEDADYLFESQFFIDNPDLRDKEALDIIQERLSVSPSKLGFLFAKKARAMWSCNPSWYPAFNSIDFNREINIFNTRIPLNIILYIFTTVDFIFFILIFLFGIISMYTAFKSKESFSIQIIVAIFFIVTFFTYCLIEVQHRYCYLIFPTLFIIASIGFERINENYLTSSPKK